MSDPPQQVPARAAVPEAAEVCADDLPAVLEAYQTPLLRYVLHLSGCSPDQAEDITQETFLRLHREVQQQGTGGTGRIKDLKSWLFKVAHNLVCDRFRKTMRQHKLHDQLAQRMIANPSAAASGGDPLGDLAHKEACSRAMAELAQLAPPLRQVLLLKVIEGMTFRQIAEVTETSVGNVAYRVNQALG